MLNVNSTQKLKIIVYHLHKFIYKQPLTQAIILIIIIQ